MTLISRLFLFSQKRPLLIIITTALFIRIIAAIFAQGYGMTDDHYLVIQKAQNFIDGVQKIDHQNPALHSLVYPGLHYLLFLGLHKIGIYDPVSIMYIVRFIHGIYSILIPLFGYLLAIKLTNPKNALLIGLMLSLLWFIPFMSVRNLIEMVCIPWLLAGCILLFEFRDKNKLSALFFAGILFGIAFAIRYQTISFAGMIGIVLLFQRNFTGAVIYGLGYFISTMLLQGSVDYFAYGYPYASFIAYTKYNAVNSLNFVTSPWYTYIGTISGILIPPLSFLLIFGFLRTWKKYAIYFWPTFIFFVIHSYYPNKQERFILPIVPMIVILAVIGWQEFVEKSNFWQRHPKVLTNFWGFFWIVNILLLIPTSTTFSKKVSVESLTYLSKKNDLQAYLIDNQNKSRPKIPGFYLGKVAPVYVKSQETSYDSLHKIITDSIKPNYVIFLDSANIKYRIDSLSFLSNNFVFQTEIKPSYVDRLMTKLNPKYHKNKPAFIYKIQ